MALRLPVTPCAAAVPGAFIGTTIVMKFLLALGRIPIFVCVVPVLIAPLGPLAIIVVGLLQRWPTYIREWQESRRWLPCVSASSCCLCPRTSTRTGTRSCWIPGAAARSARLQQLSQCFRSAGPDLFGVSQIGPR